LGASIVGGRRQPEMPRPWRLHLALAQIADVTLTRRAAGRLQLGTVSRETLDSRARTRAYS
jgi:hypothetical protein